MEEKIAEFLRRHPTSSSRQISDGTGLSEWTTNAVLKGMQDSKLVALEPLELGNEKDPKSTSFYSLVRNRNIAFHQIVREEYLIKYLANDIERLKNRKYLYHYTRLENAVKMINGEHWHLGSAENMNDKLEYENGDKDKWRNIFFSSFMTEEDENIGMWSMYSQPWNSGVKISIPSSVAKRWIRGISEIHEVSGGDFRLTGKAQKIEKSQIAISSVVYCNTDRRTNNNDPEKISWSTAENYEFRNAAHNPALTGYVKDVAWSYEKESRIRVEFDNIEGFKRVAISVPDYVIDSLILTPSPMFKGNFEGALRKEVQRQISIERSIFENKLNIDSICDRCELKKASSA